MKRVLIIALMLIVGSSIFAQSLQEMQDRHRKARQKKEQIDSYRSYSSEIDWTPDDNTWGLSYSYSNSFPLTIAANYTTNYFIIGGELGINFNKTKYTITDTSSKFETADPVVYISANPGVYIKYLSFSCGVGLLFDNRSTTKSVSSSWSDSFSTKDGSYSGSISSSASDTNLSQHPKMSFFAKPTLTGYIPICDEDYFITLNVGYNICAKFKDLNGFSFGIGFQFSLY